MVTNSGNVPLSGITLTDSKLGAIVCPQTSLDAGESMECTAMHITTAADVKAGHITNAATVEGTAPDGKDVDASDTATVTFVPAPAISLAKSADPDTYGKPGQTITYTYVVTNSGNVPLSGITLTDSKLGKIVCPQTALDAGESMECTAMHVTTAADVKAGHITNAATVEGTAPDGKDVDASDTATVTFVPAPGISLAKSADPDTYGKPGQTITYTYVVTNSGNVPLSGITLTDSKLGAIVCPQTSLDAGESMECTAVHVTTAADVKAGHITNAATVEGTAPDGKDVDASDTATVTFIPAPGISLAKTADPDTYGKPGQTITYTYVVTNSGNVPLSGITLSDSKLGAITCPQTSLDAGESMECTAVHVTTAADVKAGHIDNAATVEGTAPDGKDVDGSDTATVTFVPAPGISLAKTADPDSYGKPGQTITYTYVVTNSGNVPLSADHAHRQQARRDRLPADLARRRRVHGVHGDAHHDGRRREGGAHHQRGDGGGDGTRRQGRRRLRHGDGHLRPRARDQPRQDRRPRHVRRGRADDHLHLRRHELGERALVGDHLVG